MPSSPAGTHLLDEPEDRIRLDLNCPVFQKNWFDLEKPDQAAVLGTLRKLSRMSWNQIYHDPGWKWEVIYSQKGPHGKPLYSYRVGIQFRALAYREGEWLRILSLHPGHDSA